MHRSISVFAAASWAAACLSFGPSAAAQNATPPPTPSPTPTPSARVSEEVVVSATRGAEESLEVPGSASVVSGEELRRAGAKTVADALQNVVGLDTGDGSDNGPRLPNIGLWGLKEFDALLVTVDGVPVGGPFNPSLSQIPVEDIDRIEVVRGPQGTLYGVSAFAGMVQVFTRRNAPTAGLAGAVTGGGGSFSQRNGSVTWGMDAAPGFRVGLFGSMARNGGWQDRTDWAEDRIALSGRKTWPSGAALETSLGYFRFSNLFGSPLPVEAGEVVPNFVAERNYAIRGSRLDHHVVSLNSNLSVPISAGLEFQNTLGLARDAQTTSRSFINAVDGLEAQGDGSFLKPIESTLYDDARMVYEFQAAGRHRLVGGAAVTWGRTTAEGIGFDYDVLLLPDPVVPSIDEVPVGDNRSFNDRRTFVGVYANDEWTPVRWLTLSAGLRYDSASETLHVRQQEVGDPEQDRADDARTDGKVTGGGSALVRIVEIAAGPLSNVNVYVSARTNFKPAAPNLSEAEAAEILNPETTSTQEAGLKTRWFDGALALDLTVFHMIFNNLVVSIQGPGGAPALTNAGEERFQGAEVELRWTPPTVPGLAVRGGYAHHDARFVHFSFVAPEGELVVVDGNRLELAPRDLWNFSASYAPSRGPGAFVAVRHQNRRPLNRRNTFYTDSFYETDAGVSWDFPWGRLAAVGRNLGDSRHYVNESEIGDSQFYVAPPRRFTAELTVRF
ncbi:MAG: TonB-dependent receptor [Acidobacteriota bacterium]